jgi:hypothetical protein
MATVTTLPTANTAWTRTVHSVAAKARAAYPSLGGKIDHATALVLAGAVEQPDVFTADHYTVASATDPTGLKTYDVHCGKPATCTCEDYTHRHEQEAAYQCKHILAVWIYRRALAQHGPTLRDQAGQPVASTLASACPEAAFSLCIRGVIAGHEAQLTIRGMTAEEFRANVEAVKGLLDASQQPPADTRREPERAATQETPVCQWHGKMKESTKAKGRVIQFSYRGCITGS